MKGMIVSVYRNASGYDGTLKGVTNKADECLLVGEGVAEVFEARDLPVLVLARRNLFGRVYLTAYPNTEGQWAMGGNFIFAHDGRFPSDYPIPVHDRNLNLEAKG